MQYKHLSKKDLIKLILIAAFFSLFSCGIGILIGTGSYLYFDQNNVSQVSSLSQLSPTPQSELTSLLPQSEFAEPISDGFFININGELIQIPEFQNDNQIDFTLLPATVEKLPTFIIKSENYPLGNLVLLRYIAGIGVDVGFTQAGAVINSVFENSPASAANLQPGEIVLSVNGETPERPLTYRPGKVDLFGSMEEQITLIVMSGTNSRTIQVPRNYLGTVDYEMMSITNPSVHFSLEPKNDYILLHIDNELSSGVYRFEFKLSNTYTNSSGLFFGPTSTPTQPPIPIPTQKWIFVVK